MAPSASTPIPNYFKTPESILSTIGLNNFFLGFMVAGIVGQFSVLILVPIINSAAVCLANGLSYFSYTATEYPTLNRAVASVFSDLALLVQEAGLPFYSYVILNRILRGGERILFITAFWALMLVIFVIKIIMIVWTVSSVLQSPAFSNYINDNLHLGYYLAIAVVECMSAVFLLKKFRSGLRLLKLSQLKGGKLYRYLMRSTEIRLATIAFIGISRTIINTVAKTAPVAIEIDLFIYTVECMFPLVMYIDILASRLVFTHESSSRCTAPMLDVRDIGWGSQGS